MCVYGDLREPQVLGEYFLFWEQMSNSVQETLCFPSFPWVGHFQPESSTRPDLNISKLQTENRSYA